MQKFLLVTIAFGSSLSIATISHAQTPGQSGGRNYNTRVIGSQSGQFTGVKALYNNGASNLSTPIPSTNPLRPSQASFNTWILLYDSSTNPYPCYAELDVIRRKGSVGGTGVDVNYDGWVYAVSVPKGTPDGDVNQTQYIQRDANQTPVNNTFGGGLNAEITYQGNTLAAKRNGVSILTLNNFKCYRPANGTLQSLNPVGGYRIDYGFEGNTSASVWTSGASMGKMQQRIGNGAYSTAPSMAYPTPQLSTWSNSYNPNDNSGTMILFR